MQTKIPPSVSQQICKGDGPVSDDVQEATFRFNQEGSGEEAAKYGVYV